MKTLISIILLCAATVFARDPQYNGVLQYNGNVPSAGNTNLTGTPFRLGPGGTMAVEVTNTAAAAGTSNVVGTVLFSASGTAFQTTGLTWTNAANGTNTVTYLNTLSIPAQAKWGC